MKPELYFTVALAFACMELTGCHPGTPTGSISIKTITVTNYVTMPAEFGPDGYGFRHLRKQDSELVRECLMRMDDPWKLPTSIFSLSRLAYPQYENEYRLTKAQWKSLQDYCRLQLIDPIAIDEVVKHWQRITNGIVPFGLQVQ